jgi:quinol monooxygenase YgiN
MAVVIIATLFPVPEHRDEVIAALETAEAKVHADDGTLLYALHEGRDGRLVMIEKYADNAAVAAHSKRRAQRGPEGQAQLAHGCPGPVPAPGRVGGEGHTLIPRTGGSR